MCVGGHDAAAVAAGSPACRGHLFTMESLPPGASDLGQGSLDRPLERSSEDSGFGGTHPPTSTLPSFFLSCPLKLPCWLLCLPPSTHAHALVTPAPHPTVAKLSPGTSGQASGRRAFLRCSTLTLAGHNRGTTTGACGSSVVQRQLRDGAGGLVWRHYLPWLCRWAVGTLLLNKNKAF